MPWQGHGTSHGIEFMALPWHAHGILTYNVCHADNVCTRVMPWSPMVIHGRAIVMHGHAMVNHGHALDCHGRVMVMHCTWVMPWMGIVVQWPLYVHPWFTMGAQILPWSCVVRWSYMVMPWSCVVHHGSPWFMPWSSIVRPWMTSDGHATMVMHGAYTHGSCHGHACCSETWAILWSWMIMPWASMVVPSSSMRGRPIW